MRVFDVYSQAGRIGDNGVHPFPGAANANGADVIKFSRAIGQVHIAAPEDGRTPPAGYATLS